MGIQSQANSSRQFRTHRAEIEDLRRQLPMERFLSLVNSSSKGHRYHCPCPWNHKNGDAHPSVSIKYGRATCWGGCFKSADIFGVIGAVKELKRFPEQIKAIREMAGAVGSAPQAMRVPSPSPPLKFRRVNSVAVSFHFALTALDLRLRAARIIDAGRRLNHDNLNDADLERAMGLMARAYADQERAALLEDVADDLRIKEFLRRHHGE